MAQKRELSQKTEEIKKQKQALKKGGKKKQESADVNKLNHNCRVVGVMSQSIRLRYIHPIG